MKIAVVHVLPVEYYPPARNMAEILGAQSGCEVRVWSSHNERGLRRAELSNARITRRNFSRRGSSIIGRLNNYLKWHWRTAVELKQWRPDVIISIEPHSAIAVGIYYELLRGKARLFIHHHEYYAARDFEQKGMRLPRFAWHVERTRLYPRAEWISQTNEDRLALMRQSVTIPEQVACVLPNYPPAEWLERAAYRPRDDRRVLKLIYVGSASSEDSYLLEAAEWISHNPLRASLHVASNNIPTATWEELAAFSATNITLDTVGPEYETLPELLCQFDVGLVVYKGTTDNFKFNVPNKVFEYLAAGLDVWYPREMLSMKRFAAKHPQLRLLELDFSKLPSLPARSGAGSSGRQAFPFTAQTALAPMVKRLQRRT